MKGLKICLLSLLGLVMFISSANADFLSNWYIDADGAGSLAKVQINEFLDNNGMTYITTDLDPLPGGGFASLDFNFSNVGFLTLSGVDGNVPAPWLLNDQEITGIYNLQGSGTLGEAISFNSGTLTFFSGSPINYSTATGFYGANDGTRIAEFTLSSGGSLLSPDLTGAPNGFVTLNFYSTFLESGYWFDEFENDLSGLPNINWLLGYSTTNLSYVASPTSVAISEFTEYLSSLGLTYNGNTQPVAWMGSANGQVRANIVPEPTTAMLLGVGLLGLGLIGRRRVK